MMEELYYQGGVLFGQWATIVGYIAFVWVLWTVMVIVLGSAQAGLPGGPRNRVLNAIGVGILYSTILGIIIAIYEANGGKV